MNPSLLAILVAYYLSRFDREGLKNLGFKNDSQAFEIIAQILGVKKNYIKFRRDEFDPIHPWRKGWQRAMDNRIVRAIEALQDLAEPDLREIVKNILSDSDYRESHEIARITSLFSEDKKEKKSKGEFILRGPTGKLAEQFYMDYYSKFKVPIEGKLIDCRELGVGYDFRIETTKSAYLIEIKGLSEMSGGILFTNKEWLTAKESGDFYYLCVISNIGLLPEITFIQNPVNKLVPKRNIFTAIQINWAITEKELKKIKNG